MATDPLRVEPAIDWLTCTWTHESEQCAQHVLDCVTFERNLALQGELMEVSQWQGYLGRKTGSFFVGSRDDGYCVRVSGSKAHSAFTSIYRPDMHVSRLDCAVTVWVPPLAATLGLTALADARFSKLKGTSVNPATITHYESDNGGFTLYIGKRSSRVYARLYNKAAESGEDYYKGAWRYECELHNETATNTAKEILCCEYTTEEAIMGIVANYWRGKGVTPAFPDKEIDCEVVLPRREETTVERSLRWLSEQVKPTVARLMEAGYTSGVLAALGLPDSDISHNS